MIDEHASKFDIHIEIRLLKKTKALRLQVCRIKLSSKSVEIIMYDLCSKTNRKKIRYSHLFEYVIRNTLNSNTTY